MQPPINQPPSLAQRNAQERHHRWRRIKDVMARLLVGAGGISVVVAILLIFLYFLYVVLPLFKPANAQAVASYTLPGADAGRTLHLAMEEQTEIAVRFTADGKAVFFHLSDGQVISEETLPLPKGVEITAFSAIDLHHEAVAYGFSDGTALVVRHSYQVTFPDDKRVITPRLEYPLGTRPIVVDDNRAALKKLAVQSGDDETTLAAATADGRLLLVNLAREESFNDEDEAGLERTVALMAEEAGDVRYLLLDQERIKVYAIDAQNELSFYDVRDKQAPELLHRIFLVEKGKEITAVQFLTGDISLLVGDSSGAVVQWFPVRDERGNHNLTRIRSFKTFRAPITALAIERGRKGFYAADRSGHVGIFNTTGERTLLKARVASEAIRQLVVAPRANAMLAEDKEGQLHFWHVHNEHPEVSWSSLWGKVWYESYEKPAYVWQSTSASNDFEPKLSLVPISFGTIKAAFYAMLVAMPLSILGAIYTAYFMSTRMRQVVKPSIEIMAALPTVILGFLAGLWLAPFLEKNLPGIFTLLFLLPPGIVLVAFLWSQLPGKVRHAIPDGWEAVLLIPAVLLISWGALAASPGIEQVFFGGNMRTWLTNEMGIDFDQRNALVVGLAMGFAVIPNIFSIAEDAIFGVPKHLSNGSLALGATPWQTMWRVVLLTASPGIFSAIMIGLGRAVGETMIVLMATGNTPVIDFSIFQGLRTLSANIAVEMPESEVNSTHYRVLFLAALVLFLFTFIVNTIAELVRQHLRKKYSSL
ncbi:MAG: phosphate ABC transporter permease [Gammaproteobacteria bacterium RBG_16_57_12]|nr:MAG: phosphate ABC transporter permease [Gammaproteobacteria bacterium RBG_16_57_12]